MRAFHLVKVARGPFYVPSFRKTYYKGVRNDLRSPQYSGSNGLVYAPGTKVKADGLQKNPSEGCGKGINFCLTPRDARDWGQTVVEIQVLSTRIIKARPEKRAGRKLRAKRVKVIREVSA